MASRLVESFDGIGHVFVAGRPSSLCSTRYRLGLWRPVLYTAAGVEAREVLGHPTIEGELAEPVGVSLLGRYDLQLQLEDGRWIDVVMISPGQVQGLGMIRDGR